MSSSHYSQDQVHPTEIIVANALNQLLTYYMPDGGNEVADNVIKDATIQVIL